MFGKRMLDGPCRDNGTETSRPCQVPPTPLVHIIIVICGDSFLPETSPLCQFFQAVSGKVQESSWAFCFLKRNNPHAPKTHVGAANLAFVQRKKEPHPPTSPTTTLLNKSWINFIVMRLGTSFLNFRSLHFQPINGNEIPYLSRTLGHLVDSP